MRKFTLLGKGKYMLGKIQIIGRLPSPDSDDNWIFFTREEGKGIECLREDIFKQIYVRSESSGVVNYYSCIGVYEDRKRLRVVPFLRALSPRGEESIVGYRELITGRDYAMPVRDFLIRFSLDFLYDDEVELSA